MGNGTQKMGNQNQNKVCNKTRTTKRKFYIVPPTMLKIISRAYTIHNCQLKGFKNSTK